MPRPPMSLVPLPNYKGKAGFLTHGIPRNHFFDKPWLRYPIYSRLPEYWRKQHKTKPPQINIVPMKGTKRPQHEGLWTKDEQGNPIPVKNFPINVLYPEEVKNGLYGGEGIVRGWRHARGLKSKPVTSRNWMPSTSVESFWSEVLERWIETTVTPRTLRLIDEAYGFDHYVLKTPEYELCSKLGSNLKREMLFRLLDKDTAMYVNDPEKRQKVYDRRASSSVDREVNCEFGVSVTGKQTLPGNLCKLTMQIRLIDQRSDSSRDAKLNAGLVISRSVSGFAKEQASWGDLGDSGRVIV